MSNIIRKEITRMLREAFLNDVGEFVRMSVGKLPARTHGGRPLDCGMVARSGQCPQVTYYKALL